MAEYMSLVVAYLRAAETKREDAIINDSYAELLSGEEGGAVLSLFSKWSPTMDALSNYVALRTRSIDEALISRDESINQIVILCAGLDSRAYRMKSLSGCLVLEVDASKRMMDRKLKLLGDAGARPLAKQHHVIIADLEQDMWETELMDRGFNPKEPTFWLMEGLLYYLAYDANVRLVKTVDALSAPDSQLWADMSGLVLIEGGDSDPGENIFRTRTLKYGENDPRNGVLSLLEWQLEIQASLNAPCEFYSRAWEPVKVFSSEKGEEEVVPWFFVHATKPKAKPEHELL